MIKRMIVTGLLVAAAWVGSSALCPTEVQAGGVGQPTDWQQFYYYPYVYYPQNFQRHGEYDHMYYRYPQERQIPVFNANWHNFYLMDRPYHKGYHFHLDTF